MTDFSIIRGLFQIEGNCGYEEASLNLWMRNYNAIPKVLLDYYTQLGKHKALNSTQDFLIVPEDFPDYEDSDYLIFYSENQGVCVWGIRAEDLLQDDPPVYEYYGGEEWYLTTESLTEFLVSMAHLQAVLAMPYSNEEYIPITSKQKMKLEERFPVRNPYSHLYTGVVFLGDRGSLLAVMSNNDEDGPPDSDHSFLLLYGANEKTAFDTMIEAIEEIL